MSIIFYWLASSLPLALFCGRVVRACDRMEYPELVAAQTDLAVAA